MPRLRMLDVNGREVTIEVKAIISVDGQPYSPSLSTPDGLESRLIILEAQVVDLLQFKDALLLHQPKAEPA